MSSQMVVLGSISQSTHSETFPAVLQILVFKSIVTFLKLQFALTIKFEKLTLWVMLILCNFVNMYN